LELNADIVYLPCASLKTDRHTAHIYTVVTFEGYESFVKGVVLAVAFDIAKAPRLSDVEIRDMQLDKEANNLNSIFKLTLVLNIPIPLLCLTLIGYDLIL